MTSQGDFIPDASMIELFRRETSKHVPFLSDEISAIQSAATLSHESFEKIKNIVHTIRGSARLLRLTSVIELLKALEDLFSVRKDIDPSIVGVIIKAIEWVRALVALDDAALYKLGNEGDQGVRELTKWFSQVPLEKAGSVPSNQLTANKIDSAPSIAPSPRGTEDLNLDPSMMEFFKVELENQLRLLSKGLLTLEQTKDSPDVLSGLMRAAHSLKGAARVVRLSELSKLAHAMEDYFVAIQKGKITLVEEHIDILLKGVDFLRYLPTSTPEAISAALLSQKNLLEELVNGIVGIAGVQKADLLVSAPLIEAPASKPSLPSSLIPLPSPPSIDRPHLEHPQSIAQAVSKETDPEESNDRELRVTARSLNRLMGLAGESLVQSRWLQPFSESLLRLKQNINEISQGFGQLKLQFSETKSTQLTKVIFEKLQQSGAEIRKGLNNRLIELELFINQQSNLSDGLYREVIQSRMRAFGDGVEEFPRMVRDIAHQLKKKVRFEIHGKATPVDRDILEKLEAPLGHLLRNAVDHGIEMPDQRVAMGKPLEGLIQLKAEHRAGMLAITVSDDGAGLDIERIRKKIIEKCFVTAEVGTKLSEKELLEFIFLPGFSTSSMVTDISGRGVGLNVVRDMIQEVSGSIQVSSVAGKGITFCLLLPLTLSLIRALIVAIAGEPYAFPLSRIERSFVIPQEDIKVIENKPYFNFEGKNIGLVSAWQIFGFEEVKNRFAGTPVVIINDRDSSYGIIVDSFLSERELVVHELDHRLGKVNDISAAGFLEDGAPVLIIDVEELVESANNFLSSGHISKIGYIAEREARIDQKKILVVDDSITVRELESSILRANGFFVDSAVDGKDAWNLVRIGHYDLIITDFDMPRMNGIELIKAIRANADLKKMPVIMISSREREEDRQFGLDTGANFYLTKSAFEETSLLVAVQRLIGEA